ncbi:MAG TPA: phosphatidylglycerophosphatase A [Candidatus Limnocylindrales bacterium]|nr:phosphatidylglycerophosphatase A [Candidatus Limnocylindrales bacterium]
MRGWEIICGAAFVLILFLGQALMQPSSTLPPGKRFLLWIAQGFGSGRIPVAPGTFGSIVGLLWFAALLASGKLWVLILGTLAGVALSAWVCDFAEKQLRQKDPESVVLDEIAAMPFCFLAWVWLTLSKTGSFPTLDYAEQHWVWLLTIFILFRLFDVAKPWPVRQSQWLPGGWGITIDDVLAAVYVNLLVLLIEAAKAAGAHWS